ncbi:MAG TPA: PaaI family thioesterase [Acidimicrobiales bacterium]|nr:PaaI family thioesterase [Acidimicrobiales bacterium]
MSDEHTDRANRINAVTQAPVATEQRVAAREMTDELRRLMESVVATQADPEAMRAATAQLREIADVIGAYPRGRVYDFSESSVAGDPGAFFDNSPVAGLANPLAPPLRMHAEDDRIIGEVRWGSAYEGAPGCVHGGYVLAAFDEVLGLAQDLGGQPGMTGTLTTKFRRPTPLHTDLRFVARIDRIEGRKTFTVGELYDPEGNLLAEADAVFITVDMGKLKKLADDREKQRPR